MVNTDYKILKKMYGEKMAQLCSQKFGVILETPGLLAEIMEKTFSSNKYLYNDLLKYNLFSNFTEYILGIYKKEYQDMVIEEKEEMIETPEELFKKAGYTLYKCETEEDIQKFRKYYSLTEGVRQVTNKDIKIIEKFNEYIAKGGKAANFIYGIPLFKGEELCTFSGGRLYRCHVFFAVKDNIDEIKRSSTPRRQDEYGTSVISIQFSKTDGNALSIKNRYNHTVANPDATFSNDLENIYPGLTDSFDVHYGLSESDIIKKNKGFEIPGYVVANDGRYYKYNMEINGTYYCPSNIVIENHVVKKLNRDGNERYILADYFIIDTKLKTIKLYNPYLTDSFPQAFNEKISKIEVIKDGENKVIKVIYENNNIEPDIIVINKFNNIIELKLHTDTLNDNFLRNTSELKRIDIPNVTEICNGVLEYNKELEYINSPNVNFVGNLFLSNNEKLKRIDMPKVKLIGSHFLAYNEKLESVNIPNVELIGTKFIYKNKTMTKIILPLVRKVGDEFLMFNPCINEMYFPKLEEAGDSFLSRNNIIKKVDFPELVKVGCSFLLHNTEIKKANFPKLKVAGEDFMYLNYELRSIYMPLVERLGSGTLFYNRFLSRLELPNVRIIGSGVLSHNEYLTYIYIPIVEYIGNFFLANNKKIRNISLPRNTEVGDNYLAKNKYINPPKKETFIKKLIKRV